MSEEKKTIEVDQLAIIRGMLERQETKSDTLATKFEALDAKTDAHRAEGARRGEETTARFKSLEAGLDGVRTEAKRLNERMTNAEEDIRGLKNHDATIESRHSDTTIEHEAALAGAIVHVKTVDSALGAVRSSVDNLKLTTEARFKSQDKVLAEQSGQLASTVKMLTTLTEKRWFKFAVFAGGFAGGAAVAFVSKFFH